MEEHPLRAYGMSFVPKTKRSKSAPELVITLSLRDVEHLKMWLRDYYHALERAAARYLAVPSSFSWPELGQGDLFQDTGLRIGFGGCGRIQDTDEERELRFPLTEANAPAIALSVAVLLQALNGLPRSERASNRPQLMTVSSSCTNGVHCGHPVHGYVQPSARQWLMLHAGKRLPDPIIDAMQQAWKALAPKELRRYADDAVGVVSEDGRFAFHCFGNACDVSIYPDFMWSDDVEHACEFSCHNLDSPVQQLTLLAGIASMIGLIESEGK